jgi:hypothetical protein
MTEMSKTWWCVFSSLDYELDCMTPMYSVDGAAHVITSSIISQSGAEV